MYRVGQRSCFRRCVERTPYPVYEDRSSSHLLGGNHSSFGFVIFQKNGTPFFLFTWCWHSMYGETKTINSLLLVILSLDLLTVMLIGVTVNIFGILA